MIVENVIHITESTTDSMMKWVIFWCLKRIPTHTQVPLCYSEDIPGSSTPTVCKTKVTSSLMPIARFFKGIMQSHAPLTYNQPLQFGMDIHPLIPLVAIPGPLHLFLLLLLLMLMYPLLLLQLLLFHQTIVFLNLVTLFHVPLFENLIHLVHQIRTLPWNFLHMLSTCPSFYKIYKLNVFNTNNMLERRS